MVSKDYIVVLVTTFAESRLGNIAKMLLDNLTAKSGATEWRVSEVNFYPDGKIKDWGKDQAIIPFVLCETKNSLRKHGVKAPREFIIERADLITYVTGAHGDSPFARMQDRISCIISQSGDGIDFNEFRLWFEACFRAYCFQDENVHGSGAVLSLPQWREGVTKESLGKELIEGFKKREEGCLKNNVTYKEPWILFEKQKELTAHFTRMEDGKSEVPIKGQGVCSLQHLLEICYEKEFREIESEIRKFDAEKNRVNWATICATIAIELHGISKVKESGMPVRYLAPTRKVDVLLIDDDAETEKKIIDDGDLQIFDVSTLKIVGDHGWCTVKKEGKEQKDTLEEIETVELKINECDIFRDWISLRDVNARQTIGDALRLALQCLDEKHCSFDVVLLDLSMDNTPNADPSGYHLIKILKQFLPQVPVIAYSKHEDMGHIVRALQSGASWFLKKSEAYKLPRHVFSLFSNRNWQHEWLSGAVASSVDFEPWPGFEEEWVHFKSSFNEKRSYLTYKCLEKYPGKTIYIRPMGEGKSTSVTFQAVKGASEDGLPFQTPVIVKIDSAFSTRLEFERYFRFIRPYIANECGRVENPERMIDDENAAIVYTFAGKQDAFHELTSMGKRLRADMDSRSCCDYEKKYKWIFDRILDEILPCIHRVSPELEFHDGEFVTTNQTKCANPTFSDFPNRAFGEQMDGYKDSVQERTLEQKATAFLANYLCRMPVCRKLENPKFLTQKVSLRQSNPDPEPKPVAYEFSSSHKSSSMCSIDAFCRGSDATGCNDKCTVMLTGPWVDHVVRYRPHSYPCMTLWVDCATKHSGDIFVEPDIPEMILRAVSTLYSNDPLYKDGPMSACRAGKILTSLVYDLLGMDGGATCQLEFDFADAPRIGEKSDDDEWGEDWDKALKDLGSDKLRSAFKAMPTLVSLAKKLLSGSLGPKLVDCPIGIVHGDLNYANIMIESRKWMTAHTPFSDDAVDVRDVWFIDFARTRRDYIAHDFSVMFTSTLGQLFAANVWGRPEAVSNEIGPIFRKFILRAVFDDSDAIPDGIEKDARLIFVFRILRRIRLAALRMKQSEESYAFAVALGSMVAARISLVQEQNVLAAAAMIATTFVCFERLKQMEKEMPSHV